MRSILIETCSFLQFCAIQTILLDNHDVSIVTRIEKEIRQIRRYFYRDRKLKQLVTGVSQRTVQKHIVLLFYSRKCT